MKYVGHIHCADEKQRTITIESNKSSGERDIVITSLEFDGNFKPFEPVCAMTGKIGIYCDIEDYAFDMDAFIPTDVTSHSISIIREDGVVEFRGYLSCEDYSRQLRPEYDEIEVSFVSRLEVLKHIPASYIMQNELESFSFLTHALTALRTTYASGNLYVPSYEEVSAIYTPPFMEVCGIGSKSFIDDDQDKLMAYDVIEKIAKQFLLSFVDIGDDVYAFSNKSSDKSFSAYDIASGEHVRSINHTYRDVSLLEGYDESKVSFVRSASKVILNIDSKIKEQLSIEDSSISPVDINGSNVDFTSENIDTRTLTVSQGGFSDTPTKYPMTAYAASMSSNDASLNVIGSMSSGKNVVKPWFFASQILRNFGIVAVRNMSENNYTILTYQPRELVSMKKGSRIHFECDVHALTANIGDGNDVKVLSSIDFGEWPDFEGALLLNCNFKIEDQAGNVISKDVVSALNKENYGRISFNCPAFDELIPESKITITLKYQTFTQKPLSFPMIIQSMRLVYEMPATLNETNDKIIKTTVASGDEQEFDIPFNKFSKRNNGFELDVVSGTFDIDKIANDTALQFKSTKKCYELARPIGELDGKLFINNRYQYAGVHVDYNENKSIYYYNQILL